MVQYKMKVIKENLILAVILIQWASAAPSEPALEQVADVKTLDTAESKPNTPLEDSDDSTAAQGQRQKRWYNFYGFPPPSPVFRREDGPNPGGYGFEDPFVQLNRRLQEISGFGFRQPLPPPLPPALPQFPPFLPVFYIPQVGCSCTPGSTNNRPANTPAPPQNNNQTTDNPDVINRWPDMDDERQNWGYVINDTAPVPDNNDGARPISFDPIPPQGPLSRPPPPVDHGSSQGDVNSLVLSSTTMQPPPSPAAQSPVNRLLPPSTCDSAILSCCHMPQVTYDCFAAQGCPDPSAYGNPCDPGVIFRVIERFQMFYNQRSG